MAVQHLYNEILAHFPTNHLKMVFAYGSGIFQQLGHKDVKKNMLDFIFVVDNSEAWHRENLARNYKHYSFLRRLGAKRVALIQDKYGASVYYNTLVRCEGRVIKYGVVHESSLVNDLYDWESLYLSGRLHKPVAVLYDDDDYNIQMAISTNHHSAVHTALLLLPERFTPDHLYTTITALSYAGDFRMLFGEDKNKVHSIVAPNVARFAEIYEPMLRVQRQHLHWHESAGVYEQSVDSATQCHHLHLLPKAVQSALVLHRNADGRHRDTEDVLRSFSHDRECCHVILHAVRGIVQNSSVSQSVKGLFTAGLLKSVRYGWSKVSRMWQVAT